MRMWKELLNEMSSNQAQINGAKSYCIKIMEHLLKYQFSTSNFPKNTWKYEILNKFQPALNKCLYIGKTRKEILKKIYNENVYREIEEDFKILYQKAIDSYNKEPYSDLKARRKEIPQECPWNLEDLMNSSFEQLLFKSKG